MSYLQEFGMTRESLLRRMQRAALLSPTEAECALCCWEDGLPCYTEAVYHYTNDGNVKKLIDVALTMRD